MDIHKIGPNNHSSNIKTYKEPSFEEVWNLHDFHLVNQNKYEDEFKEYYYKCKWCRSTLSVKNKPKNFFRRKGYYVVKYNQGKYVTRYTPSNVSRRRELFTRQIWKVYDNEQPKLIMIHKHYQLECSHLYGHKPIHSTKKWEPPTQKIERGNNEKN